MPQGKEARIRACQFEYGFRGIRRDGVWAQARVVISVVGGVSEGQEEDERAEVEVDTMMAAVSLKFSICSGQGRIRRSQAAVEGRRDVRFRGLLTE